MHSFFRSLLIVFGFLLVLAQQSPIDSDPFDPTIDISEVVMQPLNDPAVDLDSLPTVDFHRMEISENATMALERRSTVVCDTTKASPRLHDVDKVINAMKARGDNWCYNSNASRSHCSSVASINGATVSLCGTTFKIKCHTAGVMVQEIKDQCKWSLYAGGRNLMVSDRRVQLH